MARAIYLMYHELKCPGVDLCDNSASYGRYALTEKEFADQVALLSRRKARVQTVSQSLATRDTDLSLVLTFDDGCVTDLKAASVLQHFGFGATFYVVSGFIGRPGYLSAAQLREIADAGFEVGCHSRTHPNLSTLDSAGLHQEIVVAKKEIEDIIGKEVKHYSCPGGFWCADAARTAVDAGFTTMATSRIGFNTSQTDPYCLSRIAIYQGTALGRFEQLCRGRGLRARRSLQWLMDRSKQLLGERYYRRVRSGILAAGFSAGRRVG